MRPLGVPLLVIAVLWAGLEPAPVAGHDESDRGHRNGYDYASEVVSPLGAVLASVTINAGPQVAVTDIDFSQRSPETWVGDRRDISNKERRVEPYQFRVP
jgi:hypothetical protein